MSSSSMVALDLKGFRSRQLGNCKGVVRPNNGSDEGASWHPNAGPEKTGASAGRDTIFMFDVVGDAKGWLACDTELFGEIGSGLDAGLSMDWRPDG